jgi:uncharacterized protein
VERDIIDSPFLQRLRRIHQLAGAFLVYPGAVHTRFEHVLGAMHVAGEITESIRERVPLSQDLAQQIRLAALLHDVGHGPFSHTFEEVLPARGGVDHEGISRRIVRESSIKDILSKHGFSARKMSDFAVGTGRGIPGYANEIIAGGLSADIMDYLLRDSYFTGVEYGKVDIHRVIDSLRVVDDRLALDHAALRAFEAMLIARYQMFNAVYFHRSVRATQLMLAHSMRLADSELHLTDLSDIDEFLEMTDELVLQRIISLDGETRKLGQAKQLAIDFRERRLLKCVFEKVMQRKDRRARKLFGREAARKKAVAQLSKLSGVETIYIYLDVPTTPSFPYTSEKGTLESVTTVRSEGGREVVEVTPIDMLPLVGSIAGFMDILRIYTTQGNRDGVTAATGRVLGKGGEVSEILP